MVINFASMLAGFVAALAITTYGLLSIMTHGRGLDFAPYTALVFGTAVSAMVCAAVVRLGVLVLLARVFRSAGALEWCCPTECTSLGNWMGCAWKFNGADGWQEGLRVFGVGVAIRGTLGQGGAQLRAA
jgi:hypothetical protein